MEGQVNYRDQIWTYEVDEAGKLWIKHPDKDHYISFDQYRLLDSTDDVAEIVLSFLRKSGFYN